jgi:DNA-binding YbaB/EbfC family protein
MGMMDMFKMMGQMREMQQRLQTMQDELGRKTAEATVGGGLVTAVVNGRRELLSIRITPEAASDPEMLESLVVAAVNQAMAKTQDLVKAELSALTNGLPIPGLDKLLG